MWFFLEDAQEDVFKIGSLNFVTTHTYAIQLKCADKIFEPSH